MIGATLTVRRGADQVRPKTDHLVETQQTPFELVPRALRRSIYGVPYVELDDTAGGRLWVTRHGWRHLRHLDPSKWYTQRQYSRRGQRLSDGTGCIYRVSSSIVTPGRSFDMVVKFSRLAQELPVHVSSRFPSGVPRHIVDSAVFNDPFQEFGALEELRQGDFGPSGLRIRTKRPLAIYSPAKRFERWQLGRNEDRFRRHMCQLEDDQQRLRVGMQPVQMAPDRQYVYLFHWTRGHDAKHLAEAGELTRAETARLVRTVIQDLAAKGFRMLDIKPGHIILRRRAAGSLLRKAGKLVYALVDFELLQRTEEYQSWRFSQRSDRLTKDSGRRRGLAEKALASFF